MTEEEKRQQKAMLLLEFQEAEDTLAHLQEKAVRMKEPIAEVEHWLNACNRGYRQAHDFDRDRRIRSDPQAYRDALNFDAALALMDEIAKTEKLIEELSQRKKALGVK
jgi:hypothetical protein